MNRMNYCCWISSNYVESHILRSPDLSELAGFIARSRANNDLLSIFATCSIKYTGKRGGEIGEGDRLIICKADGAIAVHRPSGSQAVARQGVGSSFEMQEADDHLCLFATKGNIESLQVEIRDVSLAVRSSTVDEATLFEDNTEEQIHEYIQSNPEEIEEGLRIIEHERRTPYGRVDFYAADSEGNNVVIEVKQPVARFSDVDQLQRYISHFRKSDHATVRGVLVAPSVGVRVKRMLQDRDLGWVQLDEYQTQITTPDQTSIDDWD